jgi:hypothetical protein
MPLCKILISQGLMGWAQQFFLSADYFSSAHPPPFAIHSLLSICLCWSLLAGHLMFQGFNFLISKMGMKPEF